MRITQRFGIDHPIIQAPLAGVQDSALAIAVCNAGGLGSLPCALLAPDAIRKEVEAIRAGTGRLPFTDAVADVIEPFAPPIVSFHFGLPAATAATS